MLNSIDISIDQLPTAIAGQTQGSSITLSADGAGWGWFVDASPTTDEEFTPDASAQNLRATAGAAAGKLDLLTVLIHELGHVLGAQDLSRAEDVMSGHLEAGVRRLPTAPDTAQWLAAQQQRADSDLYNAGFAVRVGSLTIAGTPPAVVNTMPASTNPTLQGGNLSTLQNWSTQGSVVASPANANAPGGATLGESASTPTRLNQVFILKPQDRFLSFTLSNLALDDATNGPDDAFEAALLNANTGVDLLSPLGLSHTDALLNLQAGNNGLAELAAQGVTHVTHADGSRTYLVDLSGIARDADGTVAVNLSFDLIGFGGTAATMGSHAGGEVITPSGKSFVVPAQASMTVKQANEWQRTLGAGLETLVNLKATLREQAAQAVRMANDIVLAARNAMEDANAAAQLMMTNPIRNFNELLQTLGKEFSGDVLYKKVIEKAKDMVSKLLVLPRTIMEAGGCFAAGTLVHTKDGLKPIEQIQVGDWVLSKPEDGVGEQAYKRVAKTFSFEDKVVRRVQYAIKRNDIWHSDYLIVTGNHPFWVAGFDEDNYPDGYRWDAPQIGWTRADELYYGLKIELPSGEYAYVQSSSLQHLWKTKNPDIAWEGGVEGKGFLINIADALRAPGQEFLKFNFDFHDDDTFRYREENSEWQDKWIYRCKVYNFEVEDFHTYYVGNLGAWVHNTNCYGTTVEYMKKH